MNNFQYSDQQIDEEKIDPKSKNRPQISNY